MKHLYYYLTGIVLLGLILMFSIVRIPFPHSEHYVMQTTLAGSYRLFNLRQHLQKYDSLKVEIRTQQFRLSEYFQQNQDTTVRKKAVQDAQAYILHNINHEIVPFWLNTEWDFNGTTETPREGSIACGYFVTTVLRHAGFKMDKYYLSRQASSKLIQTLCQPESIVSIRNNDFDALMAHLEIQEDGIYIIGLDKHVGMAIKSEGEINFVHSRKPRYVGVIKEKAADSTTLQSSNIYVVGNLLENKALIRTWLSQLEVPIS
jgi:hypothetical protein